MRDFARSAHGKLFLVGCFISIVVSAVISLEKRKSLFRELEKELTEIHLIVKRNAHDRLLQQEVLFKYFGQHLLEFNNGQASINRQLDRVLNQESLLVGYGLSNAEGELLYVSNNFRGSQLPNLLQNEISSRSFKKALESDRLVIGDTYYFNPLKKWVIPLRYAIRDSNGKVTFVIAAGIALDGEHNPWKLKGAMDDVGISAISTIYDDGSVYPIYFDPIIDHSQKKNFYQNSLSKQLIQKFVRLIENELDVPFDKFTSNGDVLPYINDISYEEPAFAVLSYDPDFNYFLGIRRSVTVVESELLNFIVYLAVGALLFNLMLIGFLRREYLSTKSYESDLKDKATHDYLTKLPNRFALESTWDLMERVPQGISVFFIDLDNFRFINDQFGHAIGDRVLLEIASKLTLLSEEKIDLYRLGGDEFLFITHKTSPVEVEFIAEQVLHRINEVMLIDSIKISLTASIGISISNASSQLEQLIVQADKAMYYAKKIRNSYVFYEATGSKSPEVQHDIEIELSVADLKQEISVEYQPQLTSKDHQILGVEVLARWTSPELGKISPAVFIPVAEKTGKMNEIGEVVIEKALEEISSSEFADRIKRISLNISVHQFMYGGLENFLKKMTSRYRIAPERICLEITESLFIEDYLYISRVLQTLKADGFETSLDDFGTGYSSLNLIRKLSIDEIKIDKSFVDGVLTNSEDKALIKSIISIGQSLGIAVIAEGIESEEQVNLLTQYGCDRFQGFYFARPMPLSQLVDYVSKISSQ